MKLRRNMSVLDQIVRLVFGIMLIYAAGYMVDPLFLAIPIALFGAINLFSAAYAYCPVYSVLGIASTAQAKNPTAEAPAEAAKPK